MRTPSGHPEGYFESFANIYRNFACAIAAHEAGEAHDPLLDYPTIDEGVSGLAFIDAIIRNDRTGEKWTKVSRAWRSAGCGSPIAGRPVAEEGEA